MYIRLFLLRCLWFLCKNVQGGVCSLLMCVCVKGRWPTGGTVQVNTSCQSVRFSRRPRPPLPVGINLTLLIHPHTEPEWGTAPTHSYLPPSKSSHRSSALCSLHWDFPSLKAGPLHRKILYSLKRLQRNCDATKVFLKSYLHCGG